MVVGQHNITHSSHSTVVQWPVVWCQAPGPRPVPACHTHILSNDLCQLELMFDGVGAAQELVIMCAGDDWCPVVSGGTRDSSWSHLSAQAQLAAEHIPMSEQRSFHLHSKADSYKVTSNNHEYHFYTL